VYSPSILVYISSFIFQYFFFLSNLAILLSTSLTSFDFLYPLSNLVDFLTFLLTFVIVAIIFLSLSGTFFDFAYCLTICALVLTSANDIAKSCVALHDGHVLLPDLNQVMMQCA